MKIKTMLATLALGIGTVAFAGTVAEWKFVESAGKPGTVADLSGNSFVLKVSGAAERIKFEKIDNRDVLTLKGSHAYVSEGQFGVGCAIPLEKFDPVKGFTFEMFFRTGDDFKSDGTQTFFINMPAGTKPGFVFRTRFKMLEFWSGDGDPTFGGSTPKEGWNGVNSDSLTSIQKGGWCHAAAVYDGAKLVLYCDGLKVGENVDFKLKPGSEIYNIGSFHNTTSNGFTGAIAWVRLSDKALTGEAILKSLEQQENR